MRVAPLDSLTNQLDRLSSGQQSARLGPFFPPHLLSSTEVGPQLLEGTVLVADLSGFSSRAAALFESNGQDDQALRALQTLINRYFEAVLAESDRCGGSPFTFDGDAISLLFTGPQHAEVAIRAALAIQKAVAATQVDLPTGPAPLQANVGLSSGSLLSGSFGSQAALVYAVLGKTATQAVQAQKMATGGQIIIAETTRPALSIELNVRPVKPGFYALVGEGNAVTPAQSVSEPAVGEISRWPYWLAAHFPPAIARQILNDEIRANRRHIAALFVNVDGLDELIANRGVDSIADLNLFFGGLRRIIDRRGGLLNKVNSYYVGDKYLVLFGLSALACADPDRAALGTAFDLQAWIKELPFPLRQRIGLSAGPASECILGNRRRREFTVIGRPVNEAVHLMELAGWGQILAVADFGREVQLENWHITPTRILLKGYPQSVTAYSFSPVSNGGARS